jgi:hypothetical protein
MADHFSICQDAALDLIGDTLTTRFTNVAKQISKADDSVLKNGYDFFAIAYPGTAPTASMGTGVIEVTWEILVDVLVRWKTTEAKAWIEFESLRSDLFNLFNLTEDGRTLRRTAGVKPGLVASFDERPRYIPLVAGATDGAVAFIAQVMKLSVPYKVNKS